MSSEKLITMIPLSYELTMKLLEDLSNYIEDLMKSNHGILYFSLDDIEYKNENFVFISKNKKVKTTNGMFEIYKPFVKNKKNDFIPPDLEGINYLPTKAPYNISIQSLGMLLGFCILGKRGDLKQIEGTKLYYTILRCINDGKILYV